MSKEHFVFCWHEMYLKKPPLVWMSCARVYSCQSSHVPPVSRSPQKAKQSKAMAGNCQGRFQSSVSSPDGQGTLTSPVPLPRHRLWDGAQTLPAKAELLKALSPNFLKTSRSIVTHMLTKIDTKLSIKPSTKISAYNGNAGVPMCTHTSACIIKIPNN